MKRTLILLTAMAFSLTACGQDIPITDVPSLVMNSFQAKFSNASDIEWEKHKDGYVVDFEIGTTEYEVKIDPAGKIVLQKQEIPALDLPKPIIDAIATRFNKYKIDDADKLEKDGLTYYQVELDKGFTEKRIVFSSTGEETKAISYWN